MTTECNQNATDFQPQVFNFHCLGQREVVAKFDGGRISSDGGGMLLRETERITGIIRQFAACFTDYRDPEAIEHTVNELVAQRVYGLALGYEDLNDHDDLRHDPLLAVMVGKADPLGADRIHARDLGKALAGKSTLNRLELTPTGASPKSRYKKIKANRQAIQRFFTDIFLQSYKEPPSQIVLDLDTTDIPLYGHQAGRFFHGYYDSYCYLPLYIFSGDHLLAAKLRPANIDGAAGAAKELERIIGAIRRHWSKVRIIVRADSGFCRENIMAWCESNQVDYVLGLAKNNRLNEEIAAELAQAQRQFEQTRQAARVFKDFTYQTLESWARPRRVIGKAEYLERGANPRFVVTSLTAKEVDAQTLYEKTYCARGDMENRIKEQQLGLFADRTSSARMRANELRVWFAGVAYTLMNALRRLGLKETVMAQAQCSTIRVKLLKIGTLVRVTVRKVWLSFTQSCPYQRLFQQVYEQLIRLSPVPLRC